MDRDQSARAVLQGLLAALLLATGCGPAVLPPDIGGDPLWEELDGSLADDRGQATLPIPAAQQRAPGPIALVDVTSIAGLAGVATGGNTHGVGVAMVDVSGDGRPDIVTVSGQSNVSGQTTASQLFINQGDGTFAVAEGGAFRTLLSDIDGYSVAAGDLDADGDVDLYIGAQPQDLLLLNDGTGAFSNATASTGAGGPLSDPSLVISGSSKVVSLGDFDNDGALDIVSASSTLPEPGAYMLRNLGDGTFEDVTEDSGIRIHPAGNPCAVLWSDFDTDSDRDLWIWNDRGGKVLLQNDGNGRLTDVTSRAGLDAVNIGNPMGIDAADIDGDGDLDYYVSNIGNNPLLRNNGDGTFVDISDRAGVGGQYGWGLAFEDFNLDGAPDLFVAQEDDRPHLVFQHNGDSPPTFERIDVLHPPVLDETASHNVAAAFADYDGDGRVDVLVAGTDDRPLVLYRNETDVGSARWLHVRLPPTGDDGEQAIGARIVIATGDEVSETLQFRDVTGGSSRASQNELSVRVGLGQHQGARWIGVLWPTGEQALLRNVAGDQSVEIAPR